MVGARGIPCLVAESGVYLYGIGDTSGLQSLCVASQPWSASVEDDAADRETLSFEGLFAASDASL